MLRGLPPSPTARSLHVPSNPAPLFYLKSVDAPSSLNLLLYLVRDAVSVSGLAEEEGAIYLCASPLHPVR